MIINNFNKNSNVVYHKGFLIRGKRLSVKHDRKADSILKDKIVKHDSFLKIVIVIMLCVFAVYEFDYIYRKTTYFMINDIEVAGNTIVSKEVILKSAGINIFDNVLMTDFDEVRSRIMENPWIKSVEISRGNDNVISIRVSERNSTFITVAGNGKRYVISEDGVVLSDVEQLSVMPAVDNIIISGLFPAVPKPGIIANRERFETAMDWMKKLSLYGFDNVKEIHVGDESNFFFRLKDGIKVFVNSVKELEAKLLFLKTIIKKINLQKLYIEYIDLRVNRGLILKPY